MAGPLLLRAAGAWIEQYFDASHPEVGVALAEITALAAATIGWEYLCLQAAKG